MVEELLPPGVDAASIDRPPATLANRLRFFWMVGAMFVITAPLVTIQMITNPFRPGVQNFKRWSGKWGRWVLAVAGIRVAVEDLADLDHGRPYVFAANHQNALDILALAGSLPYAFGFVAKAELRRMPLIGQALKHSASVFLDRSDPRRSLQSLKQAGEHIRSGNSVLIYPEGARTFSPYMTSLKRGALLVALEAGVPLVPVTVIDAYRLLDERRKAVRPGTIRIVVGKPMSVEGYHRRELPLLIEDLRERLDAPLREHRESVGL
jgi:1-acyl-sn-glycerol-3-phosphate acyltransferase